MGDEQFVWKSADTGEFVTPEYAAENPKECYKHCIEKGETQKAMEEKLEQIAATRYSEADLVSFGEYLLSQEREERLKQTSVENPKALPYEERFRNVFEADLANWKEKK